MRKFEIELAISGRGLNLSKNLLVYDGVRKRHFFEKYFVSIIF